MCAGTDPEAHTAFLRGGDGEGGASFPLQGVGR